MERSGPQYLESVDRELEVAEEVVHERALRGRRGEHHVELGRVADAEARLLRASQLKQQVALRSVAQ